MFSIPTPSREAEINDFLPTDEPAWQMRVALCNGDNKMVEILKSNSKYNSIQSQLLEYMVLAWQEDPSAKKQLTKFTTSFKSETLSTSDFSIYSNCKAWANFCLSELYLSEGSTRRSQSYLNYALSSATTSLHSLSQLLTLYNIYLRVLTSKNTPEDSVEIDQVIKLTTKRSLLGYAWYLKGKILKNQFKANNTNQNNKYNKSSQVVSLTDQNNEIDQSNEIQEIINCFDIALTKFSPKDIYSQGLVKLELAELEKNKLKIAELLATAENNFTSVKKESFAVEAKNRLIQVKEESQRSERGYQGQSCYKLGSCVFFSPVMKSIYKRIIDVIANRNDFPVLIFGERGTGKDMIANAIHTATKGDFWEN